MPRFFFHVRKDGRLPDSSGVDLPGLEEARIETARCLAHELKDFPRELWTDEEWSIDVKDEHGLVLLTIHSAAFESAAVRQSRS